MLPCMQGAIKPAPRNAGIGVTPAQVYFSAKLVFQKAVVNNPTLKIPKNDDFY